MLCVYVLFMLYLDFGLNFLEIMVFLYFVPAIRLPVKAPLTDWRVVSVARPCYHTFSTAFHRCSQTVSIQDNRYNDMIHEGRCNISLPITLPYCSAQTQEESTRKKLDVAEMRMSRWMSGVAKLDRIRNERIRGTTKVGEISKKVQESRLKWYGHVLRREDEYVGKRVMAMEIPGKRRRGRPKRRWMDTIGNDLSEKELSREDTQDRAKWRSLVRHIDPT